MMNVDTFENKNDLFTTASIHLYTLFVVIMCRMYIINILNLEKYGVHN